MSALLVLATRDMAAERGCAATLDRTHDLHLAEADVSGVGRRHAAPWSRKISATSSAGRDMTAGRYADGWSFLLLLLLLGFLRGCDSRSSGLSMPAIMPVATRV